MLRKYNIYSVCRANSTEGNLQEMCIHKDLSEHKLIRRSDMHVSWLWPLCDVRKYVSHKLCTNEIVTNNRQQKSKKQARKTRKVDRLT